MTIEERAQAEASTPPRQLGRRRLASLVTEVLAPVPTVAVLRLVVAWRSAQSPAEALRWGLLATLFASLIPSPTSSAGCGGA
jgi:hypothetical protein